MNKKVKQIVLFSTIFVVVTALFVVCFLRWNAWFGNPVEAPFVANDSICRVQLTFGKSGATSRAVSWQCGDTILPAKLVFTLENSADTQLVEAKSRLFVTTGGKAAYYYATIDSVEVGNYHYQVQVGAQTSPWYSFEAKSLRDSVTFVYVGDVQDVEGHLLREKMHVVDTCFMPDFWLFGGDLIHRPHERFWAEYFPMVADFCTETPILSVAGNHEYIKGWHRRLEERFVWTFPYFLDENGVFSIQALYAFKVANASLFLLDSNQDVWDFPRERAWLKEQLALAESSDWRIATLHHPPYSVRGKLTNFWVRQTFASLFNEQVDLVLSGHEHAYARRTNAGATPVYMISQCSPKDYRISLKSGYERYAVGQRFFQVVRIVGDTLRVSAYTFDEHALYDELTLIRTDSGVRIEDDFAHRPEFLEADSTRFWKSAEKRLAYQHEMEERKSLREK